MVTTKHQQPGFTIVELLIVIVVIGILAAITIVAYNGVQNRANDAAIQSDLSSLAKKFEIFRVDDGYYPASTTDMVSLKAGVSKSAYKVGADVAYNLLICIAPLSNPDSYAVLTTSNSGKQLYVTNSSSVQEYTGTVSWTGTNLGQVCGSVLAGSSTMPGGSSGNASGTWRTWANG